MSFDGSPDLDELFEVAPENGPESDNSLDLEREEDIKISCEEDTQEEKSSVVAVVQESKMSKKQCTKCKLEISKVHRHQNFLFCKLAHRPFSYYENLFTRWCKVGLTPTPPL